MPSPETFPAFGGRHEAFIDHANPKAAYNDSPKAILNDRSPLSPTSPLVGHSRTFSVSSDRPSMAGSGYGGGMLSMPTNVSPEPNYIAPSAASQIVTNDHDSQSDAWFDQHGIEPSGETAMVAPAAMKLVNRFLDQLLYNFLATAKSVSLASLRPAVIEVLKPKLAKGAISGADQELNEYLGEGEDEELLAFHNGLEPTGQWDLELVWKRTRLRCMVYSSLGDMEEEDEDHYTEEGGLEAPGTSRFSNSSGVVSPAVAIFLTSILEYMGEQALIVAGQAAYHRLRAKHEKDEQDGTNTVGDIADRVVVTDMDMERVALDRTLGRLWRGWKKRIRSPSQSVSMGRSFSRESLRSRIHSRRGSLGEPTIPTVAELPRKPSVTESMIHENAASIALPMTDDDVREIEIPGLVQHSDDEDSESDDEIPAARARPKSMIHPSNQTQTPEASEANSPMFLGTVGRKRSNSVPSPIATPFKAHGRRRSSITEKDDIVTDVKPEESVEKEVAPVDEVEDEKPAEPRSESNKGIIAGVIASVGAVGIGAVAGIAAVAKGSTPQTEIAEDSDNEAEEAQIMTSSRVSLGGRRSPDDNAIQSRSSSVRPQSVQSLRLVDIPHSPTRSRQGSVGSTEFMAGRPSSLSRNNSVEKPISPTEQVRSITPNGRMATASPIARTASAISSHQARNGTGNLIAEAEKREVTSYPKLPIGIAVPERSPLRSNAVVEQATPVVVEENEDENSEPVMSANTPYFGEPQFVLTAAPKKAATREREVLVAQPSRGPAVYDPPLVRTPDSAPPPLTPLREMMEGAPDTSDEASSIAPSVDTHEPLPMTTMPSHYRPYEGRRSPVESRVIANSNSPSRAKQVPRSSPSQQSRRDDDHTPKPQPLAKDRQLHTSSSSTSSSHKVRPIRTSEDSHRNGSGKSFDELIQSDQTIQYTLTPQSMRQIEGLDSSDHNGVTRARSQSNKSNKSNKSVSRATGLNSNPPPEPRSSPMVPAKQFKPVSRPSQNSANMGSRVRANAPQARDARVERESINDFADFIRSTGPPGVSLPQPANGHRGENGTSRNISTGRVAPSIESGAPRSSSSSAARKYQPREAAVPLGDHSSDLIDFIRQGPPNEKTHDNPRIPRTVAPFRTTMDSDQMSGAVNGRVSELANSPGARASALSNETYMQSVTSSVTSQSDLISKAYKPAAPKPSPKGFNTFDEEDQMPKRKQRRVRDPYAIDFSDEEDEFDAAPVRKPQRQEESLIDFLNNVPPPPPQTTSVFENVPKPVSKKPSSGMLSRFARHGSTSEVNGKLTKNNSVSSRPSSSKVNANAPQLPPAHIPIAVSIPSASISAPLGGSNGNTNGNSKYNSRPSDRDHYNSRMESERNPGPARPRVQQKSFQPREPVSRPNRGGGSSDLADFLMNTPPPPGNGLNQPNFGALIEEEEKGSSGSAFVRSVFGRRKKATA